MLITFFRPFWHGNCAPALTAKDAKSAKAGLGERQTANGTAFTAENAEHAENGADWGKATANGTAFTAAGHPGTGTARAVAGGRSRTPARGAVAPWPGKPAGA